MSGPRPGDVWRGGHFYAAPDAEPQRPESPSLLRMAGELLTTGAKVVYHAAAHGGEVAASQEAQDARWRVCAGGEGLAPDQVADGHCDRYWPPEKRCLSREGCGCWLEQAIPLVAKGCPLERWPE